MASGSTGKLKVLIVVSQDFGEFTRAIYFAVEPEFESCLLIRPSVHAVHGDDLPVPCQVYESSADVRAAVERVRPDVVLLFSGYLFAHDRIFSHDELEQLIRDLRQSGYPVLTSDPFIGWLRELNAAMGDTAPEPPQANAGGSASPAFESLTPAELEHEQQRVFIRDFGRNEAILRSLPHVYDLNPPEGLVPETAVCHSSRSLVVPPGPVPGWPEVQQALGLDPARPRWIFLISREEYRRLTKPAGRPTPSETLVYTTKFHELLADQMYQAIDQGRQPVLVAPQACTSALALLTNPADGVILLPHCRHRWFVTLLVEAEYAFYWNMFSNSLKLRILNQRPYFFSDQGHTAHSSQQLQERMTRCYYVAGIPPCLDFQQPLDAEALAREAAKQEPMLRAMAEHLLRPPRPAEALRQFLEKGQVRA